MPKKCVFFIDSSVSNYQSIIDGLTEPAEIFILDSASDGLSQMASHLYGRGGIDAIHVISHGSVGTLYLGSTVLAGGNLASYQSQLANIGSALSETGDILLYGCNVAQSDVGVQFIGNFAQATGADVAASNDETGAESLGGDWVLERETGSIQELFAPIVSHSLLAVNSAPTFIGKTGKTTTEFATDNLNVGGVALQPNGGIIVTGSGNNGLDVVRYGADGSLDASFGNDGRITIATGSSSNLPGYSTLLQSDGKILVSANVGALQVYRLNGDGSTDVTFGNNGKISNSSQRMSLQADGQILLVGSASVSTDSGLIYGFGLNRYNQNGTLDTSFNASGNVQTLFGSTNSVGQDIAIQKDGKILVAGYSGLDFALARYNLDGSLDTTFDIDGKVTTDFGFQEAGSSIAIQTDGKILVAGFVLDGKPRIGVARYNMDGSLDTSFGNGGKVVTDCGDILERVRLAIQADGKIVALVTRDSSTSGGRNYDFGLVRYNIDGSLDGNFDSDGRVTTDFGSSNDYAGDVAVQADGKIVVVGSSGFKYFAVSRYNTDGGLDKTFGAANSLPSGTVTITGTATQGQTLTASNSLSDIDGLGTVTYQWKAANVVVPGATSNTLVLGEAQVGKAITVTASYTDGHATAESVTSTATAAVVNVNDLPTGSVTITGTATQGQTLTAANTLADIDGLGTVTYQWKTADVVVPGATASTLVLGEAQVGKAITVTASYTDGHSTAEAVTSSATIAVVNVNDSPTGAVTITGTATQGQTLTVANNVADIDGLGTITYQWKAGGEAISGASGGTLVLNQEQVGKTITVTAGYTDGHGASESVTSSATTAVANVNDAPTGSVTIEGSTSRDQTLTALNNLVDIDGLGTISYQWKANGTNIANATGSTYKLTQAEVGQAITVSASYTDGFGKAESVSSAPTNLVTGVNTAPTGSVTISGNASQGQQLTAANTLADTDGLGVFSYVWKANGQTIAGATSITFTPTESQVGKTVTVSISYTDGHGTFETITSPTTLAVENVNDLPTGGVSISGTPSQGQPLTAASTVADLDGLGTFSYQWKADGVVISNATASTFTLTELQVGKSITVVASYMDGHGTTESVTSGATSAVSNVNDTPTGNVTIAGVATQGQTLTVTNSLADPDGLGTFSYQWKANGTAILLATAESLTLGESQVGKTITVTASYTDGHGTVEAVTSSATATVVNVNDVPTGSVVIAGTPIQGQTLTASNSIADADGLGTISYQWAAAGAPISGAVGSTLILAEAQVGKIITVAGSYTDGHATTETLTSAATTSVANFNDVPTGAVTISGTPTQGQTLTANNTLADADGLGTVTYQWLANGIAIGGATSSTLTLVEAQVEKTIAATASYTDGHGTVEHTTSTATDAVANVNDAPTGTVSITGNTSLGQVLTATNTLADLDGLGTISFQWSADSTVISGATSSTLTLTDVHLGKALTVTASYTDGHGTPESVKSSATSLVTNVPPQTVTGTAGNDSSLTGGNGNDAIDGLAGLDTAVYTARMAAYTISPTAISGPEGSDTFTSIERLQFLDANLAFDLDGNAGQVYRLYQAAFNRTPDLSGLGGWIAAMDDGMPLLTIASKFMESAEFQSLYGANPTNAQFVANLYTNALHRPSQQDAGSAAGWVNQLASNALTKAQALVNFSESAENKASVLTVISGGITYANASQAAGPARGQSFAGTPNADSLIGTVGNDTFAGGAGNDTIEGGKGLDIAVYSGTKASHTIARTATSMTVAGDSDGTDTLTNVERLKFDDAILAMDTAGNAGQTYRLYQAAFNRTPDKAGLTDWVKGMDTGLTLTQMATAFIRSGEFKDKYGANPTNAEFVDLLYTNALHRARAVGDDYWTNQLDSGVTREQALIGFSESAENQASLIGVIQGGIELAVG